MYSRHLYELTKDEIQSGKVFHKGGCGTMRGLHQAAALLGGTLELHDDGFVISFAGAQMPLLINEGSDSTWKARLKQTITNAITRQLAARTVDPETMEDQDRRGKRKDLYGVGPAIDIYATTVNLKGRAAAVIERHKDIWEAAGADTDFTRFNKEEVDNQRLQAIIAGSVRAPDRLFKAGLVRTPSCPFCGCEKADLRHMMWTCTAWDTVRQPFLKLINEYRAYVTGKRAGQQRAAELDRLLGLPCVANCGVVPEAEYFKRGGAPIPPMAPRFLVRNSSAEDLTPSQLDRLRRDEQGRVMVFTDGSAIHPQDRRRRRAAWATFYAPDHPWNADGPVHTDTQTVFAAELMAALHAVASASTPTRIISDCRAVVDIVRAELEADLRPIRGDYGDLRTRLRREIQSRPPGFYEVEWIKSHVDASNADEIERRGGSSAEQMRGNDCADRLAKSAMRWHDIDYGEYDQADDREFLAAVVQAMLETIWSKAFDQDVNLRGLEDHAAEAPPHECYSDDDADDQGGEVGAEPRDSAPRDPLTLTNQQLAAFVRRVAPNYQWETPHNEGPLEEIIFPDLPHYARLQRRTSALIKGRGMVNLSFAFPVHYADAVRWWLNNLKWIVQGSTGSLPPAASSVTYLECVIDFEMSTGMRLGLDGACSTTWSAKARALYYIIKALARIHTITIGCTEVGFKRAFQPKSNISSLAPLGAPVMAGFSRRPVWVCGRTPQVIAANAWRARAAHRRALATAAPATSLSSRSRAFAHDWQINYEGFPSDDRWLPKSSGALSAAIAAAKCPRPGEDDHRHRGRHQHHHDQANQHHGDPRVLSPTCGTASARSATSAAADHPRPGGQQPGHRNHRQFLRDHGNQSPGDLRASSSTCGGTASARPAGSAAAKRPRRGEDLPERCVRPRHHHDQHSQHHGDRDQGYQHHHDPHADRAPVADVPLPTVSRSYKRARMNEPLTQDDPAHTATASIYTSAATPSTTSRCMPMNSSGASSSGLNGGVEAPKQRKAASARGSAEATCAACAAGTSFSACRYLPNSPWMKGPWRGARPGSPLCRSCYAEFARSPSWPFAK